MGDLSGVWRPGTGAQYWKAGMGKDEFKTLNDGYFAQGLRLVRYQRDDDSRFAVWRPGSGAQHVHGGTDLDNFTNLGNDYFKQGLRIVDFHADGDGDEWAGVWRPGSGAQWFRPYMTYQTFHDYNQQYFSEGCDSRTCRSGASAACGFLAAERNGCTST
jgi:hypothetical protein